MRLKDYFRGIPVRLQSRLSAQAVADRINNASGSIFWPFNFGVVGSVRFGRVSLRYRSSIFEYNAKPVLVGRLHQESAGAILNLKYRAPASAYFSYCLTALVLCLVLIIALTGVGSGDLPAQDFAMLSAFIVVLPAFIFGFHAYGTRNSDEELSELIDFLEREAEAKPQPDLQPPHPWQP